MKMALIGTGKMGSMIEALAIRQGHEIVERYLDVRPLKADASTRTLLKDVSVLIDFSTAEAVAGNVQAAAEMRIPLVEGTTGWQDRLGDIEAVVRQSGIGFVYASNFSIGINLFYRVIEKAAAVFSSFDQYDPFIEESHHRFKKDAPSGTALEIRNLIRKSYPSKAIPVSSVRAGYIPGEHSVGFDSSVDTVRLVHTARSREGLAEGALLASSWITGKKGFFHFSDVMNLILAENTP